MIVLFIFSYLLNFAVSFANEYSDIRLSPMPETEAEEMSVFLQGHEYRLQRGFSELQSIGINRIYLHRSAPGFLAVKYNVTGDMPLNQVQVLSHGKVFHTSIGSKTIAFFFSGVPDQIVSQTVDQLRNFRFNKTTQKLLKNLSLIPAAQADSDCVSGLETLETDAAVEAIAQTSKSATASAIYSCLNGAQSGIEEKFDFESSFRSVKDGALEFWNSPTKKMDGYYGAVTGSIKGFFNFNMALGEALLNPGKGLPKLKLMLGQAGETFGELLSMVTMFPPTVAVQLACSIISGLGVDSILAALSGGAASVKLLLSLKKLERTYEVMSKLKKLLTDLKLGSLEQLGLSPETLTKLFQKLVNGTMDLKIFDVFKRSLDSDSKLARTFAIQGLQCSL